MFQIFETPHPLVMLWQVYCEAIDRKYKIEKQVDFIRNETPGHSKPVYQCARIRSIKIFEERLFAFVGALH
jgi:hypothetical protein